jgi:DNA-binding MarR family transcriptional regulator
VERVLAEELLETLSLVRRHARRTAGRPWPLGSVSGAEAELLRLVRRQPGISVAAAGTELGVAPNTVSTLVSSLVDAGLLERVRDGADRRVARLHLTPAARQRVDRWRDQRLAVVTAALDRLQARQRDAIQAALPALTALAAELRPEVP